MTVYISILVFLSTYLGFLYNITPFVFAVPIVEKG